MHQWHKHYRGVRRKIDRESPGENIWKDNNSKLPQHRKRNTHLNRRSEMNLEWSENNTLGHTRMKLIKSKDKVKILKSAREKQQIAYKWIPIRWSADFSAETLQARREWHYILKVMKRKKVFNQEYLNQWGSHSDLMKRSKAYRQAKAKIFQHHQTRFTTNTKGIF